MTAKQYKVTAQRKVGRQNIGPMLAYALETGERAELIEAMRKRFPHARISAIATARTLAEVQEFHASIGKDYATAAFVRLGAE